MSWLNLTLLMATIPSYKSSTDKEDQPEVVSPEDEEAELRAMF